MIRFSCLLIILFSSTAFANNKEESLQSVKAIVPIYSQRIAFQMPTDWKLAFKDQNDSSFMMEFIPKKETIKNWSEMFTITSFKDAHNKIPLQELIKNTANNHKKVCTDQMIYELVGNTPINGHKTLRAIIGCASMPNSHPTGVAKGMSEFAYFIAIKGKKDVYLIHKSLRGKPFNVSSPPVTKENVAEYISNFLPIELCENSGKEYECIN